MINYYENSTALKDAYKKVLSVCKKYEGIKDEFESRCFNDIYDMGVSAQNHLLLIEWFEKYGIKLSQEYKPFQYHYIEDGSYRSFSYYENAKKEKGNGSGRYIAWSDDGKQPLNEWLFSLHFSSGSYIFGSDYEGQMPLFNSFFDELKSYNPDFSDTMNHSLYWKLENARPVYDNFDEIVKKYYKLIEEDRNRMKADKLRKEIEEIEKKYKVN